MKKCNFCQSEIDEKAKVCPVCKRQLKGGNGCLISALIGVSVIVAFFVLVIILGNTVGKDAASTPVNIENGEIKKSEVQLVITDAYITENIIGENEIHLTVKNDSESSIDAFDFRVQAYNSYGEKLSNWGVDRFTKTDFLIAPNSEWSSGNGSWTLHFVNSATSFKAALTRYHIKETDTTVTINSNEQIWVEIHK